MYAPQRRGGGKNRQFPAQSVTDVALLTTACAFSLISLARERPTFMSCSVSYSFFISIQAVPSHPLEEEIDHQLSASITAIYSIGGRYRQVIPNTDLRYRRKKTNDAREGRMIASGHRNDFHTHFHINSIPSISSSWSLFYVRHCVVIGGAKKK